MSEFIGSRISLISRSDIRYVGILHDINSEKHTVALEQVVSHGTEGRRGDPTKEIAGSDNVYEYIVFRGGDVKDLRIEEAAQKPKPPPQVLDDPAILGQSSVRPPPQYPAQGQQPGQYQPPMPAYYYPPPPQNQGRFGPSPYQGPVYGAYPPPPGQQGMGQAPPGAPQQQQQQQPPVPQQQPQQPPQAPQQQQQPPQQQQTPQQQQQQQQPQQQAPQQQAVRPPPNGPAAGRQQQFQQQQQSGAAPAQQQPQGPAIQKLQTQASQQSPQVPSVDPPAYEAANQPTASTQATAIAQASNKTPTGPKNHGGIVPALPLPGMRASRSPASPPAQPNQTDNAPLNQSSAPTQPTDTSAAVQDPANKVNQSAMRTVPPVTSGSPHPTAIANPTSGVGTYNNSRQPGMGGFVANRGGRGSRGGFNNQQPRKVEVPSTDYDFEGANAKFNKQDLVKEVIASADDDKKPLSSPVTNGANGNAEDDEEVVIPPGGGGYYNRGSSFFDNISCENKERAEAKEGERPRGGAVWRGEEQKKNLETFGQGSVDGGFGHYGRGGWNRGRGRGRGFRGRGYSSGYNRGGHRGSSQQQGNSVAEAN